MKVFVVDKVLETKDIANVVDIEADKKMFLNREAGFKITMLDNSVLVFKQDIPYESYPYEISAIKNKWAAIMKKVIEKWNLDKTEIETIN